MLMNEVSSIVVPCGG